MTDDASARPRSRLEKQARELLDKSTDAEEFVCEVDFGYVQHNDEYADWHASTDLIPMVRALFLKELEDQSFSELHWRLENEPETADRLGFDELPARTTFGRVWRDRLDDDLRSYLRRNAEKVRELARERSSPIGGDALEPEEKGGVSKRTENRFIDKKTKKVTREMQRLVYPAFSFNRAENAHYEVDTHLKLQSRLGLSHCAAETGADLYAEDTRRPDAAPDADTHLYNIKRLSQQQIMEMVNEAIGRMVNQAKHHLEFGRPAEVAIDMTYVAYYGDREGLEMVSGTPTSKAYDWCYKFATLTVVGENVKFTLAMEPVKKGDGVSKIVERLVQKAREHVSISTVYADSEFCAVGVFQALDEYGCRYVIPSPKNKRVKREIDRMSRDTKLITDYAMFGYPDPEKGRKEKAYTNLVLLPSKTEESKTVAFVMNHDIGEREGVNRELAKTWGNRYSRRWGIENSSKTIKEFLAWTTSKEFVVRLFYFGFAVLLYNMWLLVDLLVQISLEDQHRYKPKVPAKKFLNLVKKHLGPPG